MPLYVIRHGKTLCNEKSLANGHFDENLLEEGKTQANEVKKQLQNIEFSKVYTSPLKRAKQTAKIVSDLDLNVDERLIERDLGLFTMKPINYEARNYYWTYNNPIKYKDMESLDSVFQRVYEFLDEKKEEYEINSILVVTHQGIARIIDCYFNGIPKDNNLMNISFENCEIRKYGV